MYIYKVVLPISACFKPLCSQNVIFLLSITSNNFGLFDAVQNQAYKKRCNQQRLRSFCMCSQSGKSIDLLLCMTLGHRGPVIIKDSDHPDMAVI